MNINLAPGMNEIIIREGEAPKVLDPKAPVKMNINDPIRYDFALFGYGEQQKHQRA